MMLLPLVSSIVGDQVPHRYSVFCEEFCDDSWWQRWVARTPLEEISTHLENTTIVNVGGRKAVKVHFNEGTNWGTSIAYLFGEHHGFEPLILHFGYSVFFGPTFTGAGKLPSPVNYCCGFVAGRRVHGDDGFSVRIGFDATDPRFVLLYWYVYYVYDGDGPAGKALGYWKQDGEPIRLERETWHRIDAHVGLNVPGKADSVLRAEVNGVLTGQRSGLMFRTVGTLAIQQFYWQVYHGGGQESPAPVDMDVFFRDLRLWWATAQ